MQQQPGSPRRARAGRREGGGGSHPIALEGIHGAPLFTGIKRGWGEPASPFVGGSGGCLGRGQAPAGTHEESFPGGECSLVWRSLQPETRSNKLRAAVAAAAAHGRSTAASRGSAAQGEGKGRGSPEPPQPLGTRTGCPESQGTPAPFLSPIRTVDRDRRLASRQRLAQRGCEMRPSCREGAGGWRFLQAALSCQGASGKRRTLVQLPGTCFFPDLHSPSSSSFSRLSLKPKTG